MAPVKIERLISVSSEDPSYPAQNLLAKDVSNRKWKCKTPGEKQAVVVFQLQNPSKIVTIDVGNEFSAFIEILVSKSSASDDYKVLLVTSSLMNLQDAKYGNNGNEVRFFKTENLCKPVMDEKWDRVKIVCSQPYNKQVKYGLSFIVFHTIVENESSQGDSISLGKFKLKTEATDDPISIGSLFARRKELKPELKGAAAIRAACLPSAIDKIASSNQHNGVDEGRSSSSVDKLAPSPKHVDRKVKNGISKKEQKAKKPLDKNALKNSPINGNAKKTKESDAGPSTRTPKRCSSEKKDKPKKVKPWNKFMADVIFVMSGFQNPLRSEIRNKAFAMGAKFKADWDSSCTHLICAFVNTPKFNQVKGRGKIVRKEWIEECYSKRIRFPWRRYALDKNDLSEPVSEEETFEEVENVPPIDNRRRLNESESEDTEDEIERVRQHQKTPAKKMKLEQKATDDNFCSVNDQMEKNIVKLEVKTEDEPMECSTSSIHKNDSPNLKKTESEDLSIYEMETDSEGETNASNICLPPLSDLFIDLIFHLPNCLKPEETLLMKRYIIAHKGEIRNYVDDTVNIVVCQDSDSVETLKEEYVEVTFVRPEWILRCHDENILLPTSHFEV